MAASSASSRSKCRPSSSPPVSSPSRPASPSNKIRRGGISEAEFEKISRLRDRDCSTLPLYIDETGGISIAQLAARARRLKRQQRPRPAGGRLSPAAARARASAQRQPRAGNHRDHHRPEGAGQGTERAGHRAVAAVASGRKPRRQAPAALRPARIRLDRAGRRRGDVRLSARNITSRARSRATAREEYAEWQAEMEQVHGTAEVIIGKQRHGPTGTVELQFDGQFTRFSDLGAGQPTCRRQRTDAGHARLNRSMACA